MKLNIQQVKPLKQQLKEVKSVSQEITIPKYHTVRRKSDNYFYNSHDKVFYRNYSDSIHFKNKAIAEAVIYRFGLKDCYIDSIEETRLITECIQDRIMKQTLLFDICLSEIKLTSSNFPNKTKFGKETIQSINRAKDSLKMYSTQFGVIEEYNEEQAYDNLIEVQKTVDLFAEINGLEYEDLQLILEAFKKDAKKLVGIAKKILK